MRFRTITATLAAALLFTASAQALAYTEVGDAGQTMATAQVTSGSGPLSSINGMLASQYNDSDMFRIHLDGGAFSATTVGSYVGDPMLHLYDISGTRLLFDDDSYQNGSWTLQSLISSSNIAAGDYFLAISRYSNGYLYNDASMWSEANYVGDTAYTITLAGASLAEPVPEPSTFLLFGAGLAGVAFLKRRARSCAV